MMNCMSPSSRRAWIEILLHRLSRTVPCVALLAEGVDRNLQCAISMTTISVALLAEGVDRNPRAGRPSVMDAGRPPRGGRG